MADFNQILTPGDVDAGIINVVNEIPAERKGSYRNNNCENTDTETPEGL